VEPRLHFVALSGTSVDTGLPRMSSTHAKYNQVQCTIGGARLVGLMATLSHQIRTAPWGKRAWTLQEGMLSPRCLYFNDHGLSFECAAMKCCEALHQKRSWAHNLSVDSCASSQTSFPTFVMEENGPGYLRNALDSPQNRLDHWEPN
jgi:hypothetical protein